MRTLSAQDAAFIAGGDGTPMNVAGVIRLARGTEALTLDRVRELLAARLGQVPMLRTRVVRNASSVLEWRDDTDFTIERHVGALAVTGDDPALVAAIARLHASALPADRPLWRLDLVPQGATGGPLLLFRANHALADGMSSMQVMKALFDPLRTPSPGRSGSEPSASSLSESWTSSGTTATTTAGGGDAASAATSGVAAPDEAPVDAYEIGRDLWDSLDERRRQRLGAEHYERALGLLDGWISVLSRGRHGLPRLPGDGPVQTRLSLRPAPSAELRRYRRATGARFDVVGLTVVAAAVGRLLAARGELPATTGDGDEPRIRTLVPVATSFGAGGARLGNHASFLLLALPIGVMTPPRRLALVAAEVDEALRSGQHRAAAMSMRALETAPSELTERINEFTGGGRFVDLVVSCVPGARRQLTFDGGAHELTHAVLPITEQVRLAIGWSDIAGASGVAITADAATVPELDFLATAVERATAELLASAPR